LFETFLIKTISLYFKTISDPGECPPFAVAIDHSQSQQPVPRDFPLFRRCEWLMGNRNVALIQTSRIIYIFTY